LGWFELIQPFKVGVGDEIITELTPLLLTFSLLLGVAVIATVGTTHDWIQGQIAPLYSCDIHIMMLVFDI
jgi:hypothetical protein